LFRSGGGRDAPEPRTRRIGGDGNIADI